MPFQSIPELLRQFPQWVAWRYEQTTGSKPAKVPYNVKTGLRANITDPSNFASFDQAVSVGETNPYPYAGIGFCLTPNDPIVFIDLDDPEDNTEIIQSHSFILRQFVHTYAELSPSGKGIHILGQGAIPAACKRYRAEIYDQDRYMTVTGNVFNNAPIADVNALVNRLFQDMGGRNAGRVTDIPGQEQRLDDQEIRQKAASATNGELFQNLWAGNWSGYPSQSEADLALVNIIQFYSRNVEQIERMFRQSGLGQRAKAQRDDYIYGMIKKSFDREGMASGVNIDGVLNGSSERLQETRTVDDADDDHDTGADNGAQQQWQHQPRADDRPLPLFPPISPAERYPVEALGQVLGPAAAAIARKIQVPMAMAAQSVLATASLVAQAHADVRLPYGQARPLSLYFVTVASSGDRKTTADNEALWPIRQREKALKEAYEREYGQWLIDHAAWSAEKRKIESDKKLDLHGRKARLAGLGCEPKRPLHPLLIAPDPTIEGLTKAWVSAPAALGLFATEGGMFIGGYGMSKDHRLKTAAAFSELWDGVPIKRVRATDGVTILYGRRLAVHLMVQPDVGAQLLTDPLLRDQGLLSRIPVAVPESIAGARIYTNPSPDDEDTIKRYGGRLLSILEMPWPLAAGQINELQPPVLTLSSQASDAWRAFYNDVECRSAPSKDFAAIPDFAAKTAEHAARIAGVRTIIEDPQASEISADAMSGAIALMTWYLKEALRLHDGGRIDPGLLLAHELLHWMNQREVPVIGFRDVVQFGPRKLRTKAAAEPAVQVLIDHGWIVEISTRPRRFQLNSDRDAE